MGLLDGVKEQLETIRESPLFPIYWLVGSVFVSAFTSDTLWVWIGVAGFTALMLARYFFE